MLPNGSISCYACSAKIAYWTQKAVRNRGKNGDHEILPFDVVIDFPNERINCPLEALTTTHGGILFSSSHLLVSGVSASVFVGAYRERPHLCPLCRQRRH